jgi:hydrogenase nickel incorporation protein HypA/HybF
MHELSIAMNVLDLAIAEMKRHGCLRVHQIHLRVGPLSGVVKDALESAFGLAREGSVFANTELEIEETPILLKCPVCGINKPAVSIQKLCCADCGSPGAEVVSGRELELVALEIQ